jgi:23S rRNA (uracil1939-C5)-methyltransferase
MNERHRLDQRWCRLLFIFCGILLGTVEPTLALVGMVVPRTRVSGTSLHVSNKGKRKDSATKAARKYADATVKTNGGGKSSRPRSTQMRDAPAKSLPSGPRVVLTRYAANRNDRVNEERLAESIGCEHFGSCSGCVRDDQVGSVDVIQSAKLYFSSTAVRKKRHDVLTQGLDWAVEDQDDGFYQVVVPSAVRGWRTQAKLAVAPKSSSWARDGCEFGLYQRGTHDVLAIPSCEVHHPAINRALDALRLATAKTGTAAFAKDTRDGGLRYVQLQVERPTQKVSLTLVWNAELLKETQPALARLVKELQTREPDLWHSMWCHCNNGIGNNIFARNPRRWHRLSGMEYMREPIAVGNQGWLYFSPLTFRQGNLDGFDVLATDVARAVPGGSKVCELYAGVGLLGLTTLAHLAKEGTPLEWIRCSDENPSNPRCFQRSIESLPLEVTGLDRRTNRKSKEDQGMTLAELADLIEAGESSSRSENDMEKASYMVATATQALQRGEALGADVIIVDPPRKGLEDEVLESLCQPYKADQPYVESVNLLTIADDKVNWTNDVETLIYVSCGFDALARDSQRLLSSAGGWTLHSATGYLLFPGSDHVETLCIFKR